MNPVRNRRVLILAAAIFVILVIVGLVLALRGGKKNSNRYTDPFSHETVSNPPGKTPDTYGVPTGQPLFLGIDKLLDHGLTFEQLNALKDTFTAYAKTKTPPIQEISVDVDHITLQHNKSLPNAPFDMMFDVKFDRKDVVKAKVEYTDLIHIRLFLMDSASGKTIFDSASLDQTTQQHG